MRRGLKKRRRIGMLILGAAFLAGAAVLVSTAFRETIVFFLSPTELTAAPRPPDRLLRVGGLVVEGSWRHGPGEVSVFEVTDGNGTVEVSYKGVLPDLFREGQGVVAEGYLRNGRFEASQVLAKHDEAYMPREVAEALKKGALKKPDY